MCGIFAYIGDNPQAMELLIQGLAKLEYRGYDSSGTCVYDVTQNDLKINRAVGKVTALRQKSGGDLQMAKDAAEGKAGANGASLGIAHTRWATHGKPCEENSHPHLSSDKSVVVVHNGIIENYAALKEGLQAKGYTFRSETDSEVLATLVEDMRKILPASEQLQTVVSCALELCTGTYGCVFMFKDEPNLMIGARRGSPLILGLGYKDKKPRANLSPEEVKSQDPPSEFFLASDACAIVAHTRDVIYVDDGETVAIKRGQYAVYSTKELAERAKRVVAKSRSTSPGRGGNTSPNANTPPSTNATPLQQHATLGTKDLRTDLSGGLQSVSLQHARVSNPMQHLELSLDQIEKGGYEHFMLKEIHDQANSLKNCLRGRLMPLSQLKGSPPSYMVKTSKYCLLLQGLEAPVKRRSDKQSEKKKHRRESQNRRSDDGKAMDRNELEAVGSVPLPEDIGTYGREAVLANNYTRGINGAVENLPSEIWYGTNGTNGSNAGTNDSSKGVKGNGAKGNSNGVNDVNPFVEGKRSQASKESIQQSRGSAGGNGCQPTTIADKLASASRIIMVACGTSWHSCLIGEYLVEQMARIPVEVEYASEFRYRRAPVSSNDVIIGISQSGETADTLEALRLAKTEGATSFGIVNVVGSTIARETDSGIYIHVGPEVGVASTKAFTGQVMALFLIGMYLGMKTGRLTAEEFDELAEECLGLPDSLDGIIADTSKPISRLARETRLASNFLFLGRGLNFPVALEGALKLKEISYIHAEGYPAAEMKHGPIALIDQFMPVVIVAPLNDPSYSKVKASIEEVKARNGSCIIITTTGNNELDKFADCVLKLPCVSPYLQPITHVIPLQLLSYHIANLRGCSIDQPRNLAKSVTVE